MEKVFFLILVIFFLYLLLKNQKISIENFVDGNFKICEKNDCECLKLTTAPDGSCVKYKIAPKPDTPKYKDKILYMDHVVRNNLYPLKRKLDILIFVGRGMVEPQRRFSKPVPTMLNIIKNPKTEKKSLDPKTQNLFLVFKKANRILDYFNKNDEPYIKHLIIDIHHGGKSREILKSYGITDKIVPMIYLINEASREKKFFRFDIEEDKCVLLKQLLIFIANGDLGLISYLNHLHDPFSGVEFRHDSQKNEWYPKNPGIRIHDEGTEMCKLIDYRDLPDEMIKKAEELRKN